MYRKIVAFAFGLVVGLFNAQAATANDIVRAQLFLSSLGYNPGKIDGDFGPNTLAAANYFLDDRGLPQVDSITPSLLALLIESLKEIDLHGIDKEQLLSVTHWRLRNSNEYDFAPPVDLPAQLNTIEEITPIDEFVDDLGQFFSNSERGRICNWVSSENFPEPRVQLVTYDSLETANSLGNRMPSDGNRWLDDMRFYSARASAAIAAGNILVAPIFKSALLNFASSSAAIDPSGLLSASSGRVIFTPDLGSAVEATAAITLSYLLVRNRLNLSLREDEIIQNWLDLLYETYVDGYWILNGQRGLRDPRALDLVGRGMMINAIMREDARQFNLGAQLATTSIAFTRLDGSHRFGASRGHRAVFYQGAALTTGLETLFLLSSQIPNAIDIVGPTLSRQAAFLALAYQGQNENIWQYARENVAIVSGSNFRQQDRLNDIPAGIDMILNLFPDHQYVDDLIDIRTRHRGSRIHSELLNATCFSRVFRGIR